MRRGSVNIEKKYVCYSGFVYSKDGDKHKVPARNLPRLYKVNPAECIFIESECVESLRLRGYSREKKDSFRKLFPRSDGNYTL